MEDMSKHPPGKLVSLPLCIQYIPHMVTYCIHLTVIVVIFFFPHTHTCTAGAKARGSVSLPTLYTNQDPLK